jgi:putative CocE/NonD family hydrolase
VKLKTIFFLFFLSVVFVAQTKSFEQLYTKQDFMIEMRDGIKLYTVVYSPKDTSIQYPFLITRTPYGSGPYKKEKFRHFPEHLTKEKFIFVYQDVRGKFMSEGKYVNMRPYIPNKYGKQTDEASDTYDTIDWLVKNIPHNNGRVGIYGISYPGFYSAMSLNDSHPALKAVSPQAPIADWFTGDDMHHNGAFTLSLSYVFFSGFGIERKSPHTKWPKRIVNLTGDAYNYFLNIGPLKNINEKYFHHSIPFWNDITEHDVYDDFWKSRNTLNYFNNVKPAVMTVGGWFDGEDLYGALNTYKTIERKNPNTYNILVMGPWIHGGWARNNGDHLGDMIFGENTSDFYRKNIELKFFKHFLKSDTKPALPEVYAYKTGANEWCKFEKWPPENSEFVNFYLSNHNKLLQKTREKIEAGTTEYLSDPANPVPYTALFHETNKMYNKNYPTEDQRFASARPDVIFFETDTLEKDITIAGPIGIELFVSTTGTDADWVVKLIDVFPNNLTEVTENGTTMANYQMLIRGDIFRGKFRKSLENPKPFLPNKITKVKFKLNDSFHTFLKGHKIMVQIQSSWFPLFDRNPQTFTDIFKANANDFKKATHKIYYSKKLPSKIRLKILK